MENSIDSVEDQQPQKNWKKRILAKKYWLNKYFNNPFTLIPFFFIVLIISIYPLFFRSGKISYLNQDWAGFSAYLQMIFTFVNIILFGAIAITTIEYSKTSDVTRRLDNRRSQMPVIGFSR